MANIKSIGGNPIVPASVEDGAITTAKLSDGAVTDDKLVQTGGVLDSIKRIDKSIDYLQSLTVDVLRPTVTGAGTTVGVTFTVNADGTITVQGTSTAGANRLVGTFQPVVGKTYVFETGRQKASTHYWFLRGINGTSVWIDTPGYTWKCTTDNPIELRFSITDIVTIDETYYPVIRELDTNASIAEKVYDVITVTDHHGTMEVGNINMGQRPFWWTASTTLVRTMQDHPIRLQAGDRVYLTDYSAAEYYIGWKDDNGTYNAVTNWQDNDYVAQVDGDYWVRIRGVPEVTVTDIRDYENLLRIEKHIGFEDYAKGLVPAIQRTDWTVRSINHRGYSRIAPENTLPAFALSAQLGWKYVETDVRFTSDGVPVLLHDQTINRTARNSDGSAISGDIDINSITYEQALTYDFGIYMGEQYAGTKIPTLTEFITLCKRLSLDMYIEIKDETGDRVKQVVDLIKRRGMIEHASFTAFSYSALQKATAAHATARIGLIGSEINSSVIGTLDTLSNGENNVFYTCNSNNITASGCDLICEAGYPLEAYTPNYLSDIEALDPYVSGITSDWVNASKALFQNNLDGVLG